MQTAFAKYEGAGNDFILIDNREGGFTPRAELIAALCDRHFGIGADGLMTLARNAEIDCSMRYYNADGSEGEMCGNGARCFALFAEHRGIAERMYKAYPEVFSTADGRECRIESRSTLVPRCILSMAAFNERLKELNPAIRATRDASARDLCYLANGPSLKASRGVASAVADSLTRVRVNPARFVKSLVTDPGCIDAPLDLMEDLFMLAAITQDVSHLGIESFYEIFTREELYALWECENVRRYLIMGPSARFGDPLVADARPLLRNIVETGERVVAGESDLSASLRFGHDTYVVPLLALLRAEGAYARVESLDDVAAAWNAHTVTPMGTNVQFIFFRNPETGDVRVRVLHNERDANLPLAGGPYYPWKELKRYCEALYGAEN